MAWNHIDESFRRFVHDTLERWDTVRIAETDGEIAGFACLEGNCLDQLFVKPDKQRLGIVSALMNNIKGLRPQGFMLYTFQADRPARRFYERHGLKAHGIRGERRGKRT